MEIVDRATEAGSHEEAYRAIVNFTWSSPGYLSLAELEQATTEARRRTGVAAPFAIGPYLELSTAAMIFLPASRWQEAHDVWAVGDDVVIGATTSRIVWLGLGAALALRRGDLTAAGPIVEELQPVALSSGEAQRIVPMTSIAVPWLVVADKTDELEPLLDQVLPILDGQWPSVLTVVPAVRALAAVGAEELLERTLESMRHTPSEALTAMLGISLTVGEALLALLRGRTDDAVQGLSAPIETLRKLGYDYDAACLELDLARALEAHGDTKAAEEARGRAASVLEPLAVVNAF